jgi:hypothetical protein
MAQNGAGGAESESATLSKAAFQPALKMPTFDYTTNDSYYLQALNQQAVKELLAYCLARPKGV